jgi:hypothetical protein
MYGRLDERLRKFGRKKENDYVKSFCNRYRKVQRLSITCQIACKDEACRNDWSPYAKPQPLIGQFLA